MTRIEKVASKLTADEKWSFVESFSTIMKAFSAISSDNSDIGGLSQQPNELLKSIFSEDFIGERELQGTDLKSCGPTDYCTNAD